MMILVTGGARSGKSRHAEALIADSPNVLYIATSQIFDEEMAARIQHHRDGRPAHWRTAERWQHLDELITKWEWGLCRRTVWRGIFVILQDA